LRKGRFTSSWIHFDAVPALGRNFYAAPAPTLLCIARKSLKTEQKFSSVFMIEIASM
jgi:hypothetical protein